MVQAIWNGQVIAESDKTELVEGNHYFPPDAIHREFVKESDHHTVCGWKGVASYYDVVVGDETNPNAAWFYPEPLEKAAHLNGWVAFWHGVEVK